VREETCCWPYLLTDWLTKCRSPLSISSPSTDVGWEMSLRLTLECLMLSPFNQAASSFSSANLWSKDPDRPTWSLGMYLRLIHTQEHNFHGFPIEAQAADSGCTFANGIMMSNALQASSLQGNYSCPIFCSRINPLVCYSSLHFIPYLIVLVFHFQ